MQHNTSLNPVNLDYKEKYLDMRDINKDLKKNFRELEDKVAHFITESHSIPADQASCESNKENHRKSDR